MSNVTPMFLYINSINIGSQLYFSVIHTHTHTHTQTTSLVVGHTQRKIVAGPMTHTVNLGTWEVEIWRIAVQGQPKQVVPETASPK
jgi:hypothetical protein